MFALLPKTPHIFHLIAEIQTGHRRSTKLLYLHSLGNGMRIAGKEKKIIVTNFKNLKKIHSSWYN